MNLHIIFRKKNEHSRSDGGNPGDIFLCPACHTWWQQPLSMLEMAGWFAGLWFFGFLITGALLSLNLPSVRMGDPTFPYLLSGIGYPGLMLVTAGLALRFLRAFEGQQIMLEYRQSGSDVIE